MKKDNAYLPTFPVLVHLKTGTPYIVETVKEASQGHLQYEEKERWNMEKIEQHYQELLKNL